MMNPQKNSWWENLISKNPMMAEVTRFRKRFLSFRGSSVAINGGIGIVLVLYALFAMTCVYYRGDIDPIVLLMFFTGLMLFVIPLMLHASIAGERERRSWDMLLVAPITHGQIIVGKFMGAFAGLSMAFGLYLIPVLIDAAFHSDTRFVSLILAILTVLAEGTSLIAMTLLISSRVKRPLIALAVSIGVVMVYFFFVPGLIATMSSFTGHFFTGIVSPFEVLRRMDGNFLRYEDSGNGQFSVQTLDLVGLAVSHLAYQLVITVSLLVWATKTLVFADHEVKFISKKKRHA
jgi:ABC-type transport system involved in multi-copper enzyme maturation permease subunit